MTMKGHSKLNGHAEMHFSGEYLEIRSVEFCRLVKRCVTCNELENDVDTSRIKLLCNNTEV
jgi:hypothetical protein